MQEQDWPLPDEDARLHSARLVARIADEIDAAGGAIPFDRYMELALYAPGLGYYSAGARKFGEAGDFVTAPEVSPLFAQCLARQCEQIFAEIGAADILELGAGSGVMAADVLTELERRNALPLRYLVLEVSAELRDRQRQTLAERVPHLMDRIAWLDAPPERLRGVVLANEVLDALPVKRFRVDDAGIHEGWVVRDGARFALRWQVADEAVIAPVRALIGDLPAPISLPYESEWCPQLPAFIRTLADALEAGVMLFIDYGYPRAEYYRPERAMGTLMCHYRHRAHEDPFVYPGLQDITAFVDFTAVAQAAVDAGLELDGYTTQAQFLLGAGLDDVMPAVDPGDTLRSLKLSQQVQKLTLPGEMGDRFKVMGVSRGVRRLLDGFSLKDLSASL